MSEVVGAPVYPSPRAAYLAGAAAVLPFVVGTIPFGIVTGIATRAAGLSSWEAIAMTMMVFAGTAHLAALPLLVAGAPALVIIFTAFVINLRFAIYSASVAPHFRHLPMSWKALLGYFMTDTGFALLMRKLADHPGFAHRQWYFLGGGNVVAVFWIMSAVGGVAAGAQVPASWQLEFAATLAILALLAPFVRSRPEFAAAIIGGGVALAASGLPMKLGLVCGAVAGIAGGVLAERHIAGARG